MTEGHAAWQTHISADASTTPEWSSSLNIAKVIVIPLTTCGTHAAEEPAAEHAMPRTASRQRNWAAPQTLHDALTRRTTQGAGQMDQLVAGTPQE
jgi:hypothetical protein